MQLNNHNNLNTQTWKWCECQQRQTTTWRGLFGPSGWILIRCAHSFFGWLLVLCVSRFQTNIQKIKKRWWCSLFVFQEIVKRINHSEKATVSIFIAKTNVALQGRHLTLHGLVFFFLVGYVSPFVAITWNTGPHNTQWTSAHHVDDVVVLYSCRRWKLQIKTRPVKGYPLSGLARRTF
jgi:hypothetical protein